MTAFIRSLEQIRQHVEDACQQEGMSLKDLGHLLTITAVGSYLITVGIMLMAYYQ